MRYLVRYFVTLLFIAVSAPLFAQSTVTFGNLNVEGHKRIALFVSAAETLDGVAKQVDELTDGRLQQALHDTEFKADLGNTKSFYGLAPYTQIAVIGTGSDLLTHSDLQDLGGYAIAEFPSNDKETIAMFAPALSTDIPTPEAWLAMGASLRDYHFDKYKKESSKTTHRIVHIHSALPDAAGKLFMADLQHVVKGVHLTRDMASEPGKSIYPEAFVERVKQAFKGVRNVDIDVLDVRDMKKNNMGALLGVGQGSIHDPRLLVIEYKGAQKDNAPIALVGKGITFDTGGISLKPNNGMWAMKADLSGAAAVAGTMLAIASREEAINVVGLMPLAENMPAEDAIRPGDVLTTMQGTSIEIISTDAEGRLILADAVRYAQDNYKPKMLVNIATLTGSAGRALSDEYAAVITREWDLSESMMDVGKRSGEHVWPLPLHPNHFKQIKSDIADIKNSGAGRPGASIGAAVVGTFIDEDLPWVHLDIAGVDWLDSDIPVAPKGSQGWGVRFLDQLLREHADKK